MQGGQRLHQNFVNSPAADEANRSRRLTRIRLAAKRLAERYTTSPLPEDLRLTIVNPHGPSIWFRNAAQERALLMGLVLHLTGKGMMMRKNYGEALEFLYVSEEAFAGCNLDLFQIVDNFAILQIDIVWCMYMLGNVDVLAMQGFRLSAARNLLNCLHGKELSLMRKHELAIYMKLDHLEGVVAYRNANFVKAKSLLLSADQRFLELIVSDIDVEQGMRLGFGEGEVRKAVRLSDGNIVMAIDSLQRQRRTNPLPKTNFSYLNILQLEIQRTRRRNDNGASPSEYNQYHGSGSEVASSSQAVVLSPEEETEVSNLEDLIFSHLSEVHILQCEIKIEAERLMITDYEQRCNRQGT